MPAYFRSLIVWQKAFLLSQKIYSITKTFPAEEKFGLIDQMRRCSVSVASNIAEGNGRGSNPDYVRFLNIAKGSVMELMTQILIAESLGYIQSSDELISLSEEIIKMLYAIIKNLK